MPNCLIQTLLHSLFIIRQNLKLNLHLRQLANHSLALDHVLRFVFLSGFSSPADHQQHGDRVNFLVSQRHYGVYYVPEARVLQINDREFVRRQVVTEELG
jgi:hypothetical protein